MGFEPLDRELEEALSGLVAGADDDGWATFDGYIASPEYRELRRIGMFDDVREYIDGSASVLLSYRAARYFKDKERAEGPGGTGAPNRIASVAGTFAGAALKELMDR